MLASGKVGFPNRRGQMMIQGRAHETQENLRVRDARDRAADVSIHDNELTPEELKRRKKVQHAAAEAAYILRQEVRLKRGVWVGAVSSALIAAFVPGTWFYPIFMALVGAACAFYVVRFNISTIYSIMIFGASAAVVCLIRTNLGGLTDVGVGFIMVSTWLFHMALGFLVATLAHDQKIREDAY
jgi:hypothetical protein